jgi:hypothetical protein
MLSDFDLKLAAQSDAHQLFLETLYGALYQANPEMFTAFEIAVRAKLPKSPSLGSRYGESALLGEAEINRHVEAILRSAKAIPLSSRT